jgi:lipid-A-disaccharide synthase
MSRPIRIFISAGEESGDRHGADLVASLKALRPDADIRGVGGKRMARGGCEILHDPTDIAVMWFVDVFKNLRTFVRLFERTARDLGRWKPDVLVPIDYPGFNLRLADRAKGMDVPVAYFVSPQVWAWLRGRVHRIAEVVDRMIVIFPFEEVFYEEAGVRATYVGHPVCDRLAGFRPDPELAARYGAGDPVVALLPGSRRSEVKRNLPLMLEAAGRIAGEADGAVRFASAFSRPGLASFAGETARGFSHAYAVHEGQVHDLMALSRMALVCAGSATVELAYLGIPMVVLYKVAFPSFLLSMLLNRAPHIAMVNLLAGARAVPEFLLWRPRAGLLAEAALPLLRDGPERRAQCEALAGVRTTLGEPGASNRAAKIVLETAEGGGRGG